MAIHELPRDSYHGLPVHTDAAQRLSMTAAFTEHDPGKRKPYTCSEMTYRAYTRGHRRRDWLERSSRRRSSPRQSPRVYTASDRRRDDRSDSCAPCIRPIKSLSIVQNIKHYSRNHAGVATTQNNPKRNDRQKDVSKYRKYMIRITEQH